MAGKRKVKRYRRIYTDSAKRKRRHLAVAGAILACVALIFVGYSLVDPIQKLLDGDLAYDIRQDEPSSSVSSTGGFAEVPSSSEVSSKEPLPPQKGLADLQAVYAPPATVQDAAAFSAFLENSSQKGYTAIIFDAKDDSGMVLYQSALPEMAQTEAVVPDAFSMVDRLQAAKAAGLTPIVRVSAFQDNKASKTLENSFVMFGGDHNVRWIDNDPPKGQSWLNPESPAAQAYISAIVGELADLGAPYLMVRTIQYPSGYGTNLTYYGERSQTDKLGVLRDYVAQLEGLLSAKNCALVLEVDGAALLFGEESLYGGNPSGLGASAFAPVVFPSRMKPPLEVGGQLVENPAASPYDATKVMLSAMKAALPAEGKTILFPLVEASFAGEQERAAKELQMEGYAVYSGDGLYP